MSGKVGSTDHKSGIVSGIGAYDPVAKWIFSSRRTGDFDIANNTWTLAPFTGTGAATDYDTYSVFGNKIFLQNNTVINAFFCKNRFSPKSCSP